jgi:hypothetical protein
LLVLVFLLQSDNPPAGKTEEVEDDLLCLELLAKAFALEVVVDGRPVLAVLLHQVQESVGLLKGPFLLLLRLNESSDSRVDLFPLALAFLLVLEWTLLLVLLSLLLLVLSPLLPLLFAPLLPSSPLAALLPRGIEPVVDRHLLEIMMGEQQWEIILAVAPNA